MMTLGQRLRELRKKKDKTQKQLGAIVGVAESTISLYEADKRTPDTDILKALAEYFEVTTDYLLGHNHQNQPAESIAMNSDIPYDELPPEAVKQIYDYIAFIKEQHKKNK
jgi:transcriptional regulator with XRE-family HTH domain